MALVEIKTAKITEKGQIVIPKSIRKLQGFNNGSQIVILTYNDRIELRAMDQVSKGMQTAIASEKVLEKEWNTKEEDEAWKDL